MGGVGRFYSRPKVKDPGWVGGQGAELAPSWLQQAPPVRPTHPDFSCLLSHTTLPPIRSQDPLLMMQIISSAIVNAPPPHPVVRMLMRTNFACSCWGCFRGGVCFGWAQVQVPSCLARCAVLRYRHALGTRLGWLVGVACC